jgi:hypothetical protein
MKFRLQYIEELFLSFKIYFNWILPSKRGVPSGTQVPSYLSPWYCGRFGLLYKPQMIGEDDFCSNWWNKNWQGKPKYSEKTCPSATLSTTKSHMTRPGLEPRTSAVGSQRLTAWAMARPVPSDHFPKYFCRLIEMLLSASHSQMSSGIRTVSICSSFEYFHPYLPAHTEISCIPILLIFTTSDHKCCIIYHHCSLVNFINGTTKLNVS